MLRTIDTDVIRQTVREMCIEANRHLPEALCSRLKAAAEAEEAGLPRQIMRDLCDNLDAANALQLPICQDTGMAVIFLEIGQEVHLTGADLTEAVNRGVREGYLEGFLRCSVVADPIRRGNTGDNTPAVLHTQIVPGDRVKITVAPKGFGSENMSRIKMCLPSASRADIVAFIVDTVRVAGSNPCPPMVIGVGIGGDFELCAYLAKKALCRADDCPNPDSYYAELERDCLAAVNAIGIGPQGFGGKTTALSVKIEQYPTHIAGLPVAVNIGCHVTRHISRFV